MPNPLQSSSINRLLVVVTVLVTGAGACSSGGSTRAEADENAPPARNVDSVSARQPVPEHFSMIFGEGGGVAGRWDGFASLQVARFTSE